MITERYEGDYTFMLGEGEDTDEFFMRLVSRKDERLGILKPEWGTEECDLYLLFGWHRTEYLEGRITREEREELVDDLIRAALTHVGTVEPSTELVGYF